MKELKEERVINSKVTLMLHWYYKAIYNLGQFFSLKRHTIWNGGSILYVNEKTSLSKNLYLPVKVRVYLRKMLVVSKLFLGIKPGTFFLKSLSTSL